MVERLRKYNWPKLILCATAVGLIALGTQAPDFIREHPTAAIVCVSIGTYVFGFFQKGVKS